MSALEEEEVEPLIFTSEPRPQNKLFRMSTGFQKYFFLYVNMSVCQYEQNATFQLGYQNESCSECHQDVRPSLCQYVNMSRGLYVSMSICQIATFQLRYQNESCS